MDGKENKQSETKSQSPKKRKNKKKHAELDIERQFGKDLINEIAPQSIQKDKETSKERMGETSSKQTPDSRSIKQEEN